MGLELDQRGLDGLAFRVVLVFRRFGKQCIDPLALGYLFRTDAQRCQVAMGGDVIQCFLMQIICIQEDLQAGELLGE